MFDQAGHQKRTIGSGGSGDGQFSGPYGISIKGDVMYVAEYSNHCIQKLTTGGQFLQMFGQWSGTVLWTRISYCRPQRYHDCC